MEKGDFVELDITDMTYDGLGIGHDETGITVFVSGAVYGDKVRVGITDIKKNLARGKAVQIIKESEFKKKDDICPYIDSCGGCGYGKLLYDCQTMIKEKSVKDKLVRIAGIENPTVFPIVKADSQIGYRNKATVAVYNETVGFKEKKSNRVVDCKECRIQHPYAMVAAEELRKFIKKYSVKGIIENMVVRVTTTGETMVILNRKKGKDNRPVKANLNWEELAVNIDNAIDNSLESFYLDEKWIAGKHTILESLTSLDGQDLDFEISPLSFYQVNPKMMLKLYDIVREKADLTGQETLFDLYCGVGTIGIFLAKNADKVYGIESCKPAVIDANRNSVINRIVNTRYIAGKAEDELPFMMGLKKLFKPNEVNKMVEREHEFVVSSADVVVLDPPRSGCEHELLDAVIKSNPKKIVYVSCDPATLSRDIKYIKENSKFDFIDATPVDMFPETAHVETVALLSRR